MHNKTNVTLQDVANSAQVSRNEVMRVVLKQPDVAEHTRRRIYEAMKHLGFPYNFGHAAVGQTEKFIGIAVPGFLSGDYIHQVVHGITDNAKEQGYTISLSIQNHTHQDSITQMLVDDACQGLILIVPHNPENLIGLCQEYGRHCVTIDYPADKKTTGAATIGVNNRQAIVDMMRYLIALGHRRIAFITGNLQIASACERLMGYRQAVTTYELPDDPALVVEGDWSHKTAYHLTQELLALPVPPTAIVASNDPSAFGAIQAANEAGLVVGNHISITGFDDLDIAATIMPALTTVRQPAVEMGRFAAEMLACPQHFVKSMHYNFDTELIIRQSTGAAPR